MYQRPAAYIPSKISCDNDYRDLPDKAISSKYKIICILSHAGSFAPFSFTERKQFNRLYQKVEKLYGKPIEQIRFQGALLAKKFL
jgi:hypothetical protein